MNERTNHRRTPSNAPSEARGRLLRDTKGAVMAEFVIAIVPLFITFFSFVQLAKVATARLVVKHGTIIAARAASVISNVHDNNPGATGGNGDIQKSAIAGMAPWSTSGSITGVNVTVDDQSSQGDPYGWVTVTVKANYHCNVPLGALACGGRTKILEESYRMPHQGARYKL